jgi:hypothetical protein
VVDLLTPEAQTSAHYWASVLLAHAMIGAVLASAGAALFARLWPSMLAWPSSVQVLTIGYAGLWEGAVQRLGAGLADAAVDTVAVAGGALVAWGLWAHRRGMVRRASVALAVVLAVGVWRRRKGGGDA